VYGKSIGRTFGVEDKIIMMPYQRSPYFGDAHFCRDDGCGPFYNTYQNKWTEAHYEQFSVPGRGYKDCQVMDYYPTDTFFFQPNKWVFSQHLENTGHLQIEAIATLQKCGRLLVEDVAQIVSAKTLLVLKLDTNNTIAPTTVVIPSSNNLSFLWLLLLLIFIPVLRYRKWFLTRYRTKSRKYN